ncbi:Peptidase A1 domain-containing protein [Aphelenchoides besseyi]|nr:Peptidase A1 domain-containing protein [Aphelenchoides besseyi]
MRLFILLLVSFLTTINVLCGQKSFRLESKVRFRTAAELRSYHEEKKKLHKNYIPNYPDSPILSLITVGTPSVDYSVAIETGEESLWLLDKSYPGRNTNQPYYDANQSSTAQLLDSYFGFSGNFEVSGDLYEDMLGILGFPQSAVTNFGVVKRVFDPYLNDPEVPSGVLGLSWNPADKDNLTASAAPILHLFSQFGSSDRFFVQWLQDVTDAAEGREYSMWTQFGANLDGMCEEDYITAPLTYDESMYSLKFTLDSFSFSGQVYDGGDAKLDTGVPTILLPYDTFQDIYTLINPSYNYDLGIYEVECDQFVLLDDFVFIISKQKFAVPSTTYVVDLLLGDGMCAVAFDYSDYFTTPYVLGTPFHWEYCLKMDIDNTEIGFSKVVKHEPTYVPETV